MVDDDADATRLLLADAGLLEFGEREAAALADFPVVAHRLRADGGAEEGQRADAELRGFRLAGLAAAELAPGLVEPGADSALPVLAEVVGVEDCGSDHGARMSFFWVLHMFGILERGTNRCWHGNPWLSLKMQRRESESSLGERRRGCQMRGRCYIRHGSGQSSWFLGESRRNDVFDRTNDIREDDPAAFRGHIRAYSP